MKLEPLDKAKLVSNSVSIVKVERMSRKDQLIPVGRHNVKSGVYVNLACRILELSHVRIETQVLCTLCSPYHATEQF